MAKVALQKYRLTQAQLRSLTMAERPELDASGKVVFVPNERASPIASLTTQVRPRASALCRPHGRVL